MERYCEREILPRRRMNWLNRMGNAPGAGWQILG